MNESISAWWWAALVITVLYAVLAVVVLVLSSGWQRQVQGLRRQVADAEAMSDELLPVVVAQLAAADQAVQVALRANGKLIERLLQGLAGPIIGWAAYRLLPPRWRGLAAAAGRKAVALGARALAPAPASPPRQAGRPGAGLSYNGVASDSGRVKKGVAVK